MLSKLSSVEVAGAAVVAVLAVGAGAGAASQFGWCRWLAGGWGFVVAVGYASVSPQAGTNPHPAATPMVAYPGAGGRNMPQLLAHRCPTRIPPLPLVLDQGPAA